MKPKESPCSAVGSKEALGSSNKSRPTLGSAATDRINVRDLVIGQRTQLMNQQHVHTRRAVAFDLR